MRLYQLQAIIIALLVLVFVAAANWRTVRMPATTKAMCEATDKMGRDICAELRQ